MSSVQKLVLAPLELRTTDTTTEAQSPDNNWVDFVGILVCTAVVGAAPTVDVKIQHSVDGSTWFDLTTFTQLTAAGNELKNITAPVLSQVRAVIDLGGTITSATLKVELAFRDSRR